MSELLEFVPKVSEFHRLAMLKLSRKLDYAILAISQLSEPGLDGPISARTLAERTRIPPAILANILKELGRHGLVHSVRGVHGGYELIGRPEDWSVGELIRRMEGAHRLVECVVLEDDAEVSESESSCDLVCACPVKGPLRQLHDRIHRVLDELTFDQLVPGASVRSE